MIKSNDDWAGGFVIRNRRYVPNSGPAWRRAWSVGTLAVMFGLVIGMPSEWFGQTCAMVALFALIPAVLAVGHIGESRFGPVEWVLVGSSLVAIRKGIYDPGDVDTIRFGPDPDEDYAEQEGEAPIPLTQATFVRSRGRRLRLVIDTADAARVRAWAEARGIPVIDPGGYSSARPAGPDEP
jgi:hypothetical protein